MTPEKWQNILGNIKDNFEYENESKEHLDEEGGIDIESIEFKSPMGRIRLEYVTKPIVLEKKTTYSKRIGSDTKIDYVYSPDEKTCRLIAYKWNEESKDWEEMDANKFDI